MTFFSVIIPTFNRADLISQTIDSIITSQFLSYEIIVVDDGSTDNTLDILKSYGSRIKIFSQNRKGPGAARNLGVKNAKGTYITFLDSDDLWFPWTLFVYEKVIQENHLPSFVVGSEIDLCDIWRCTSVTYSTGQSDINIEYFKDYYESANRSLWIGTCAVAIKADILRQVGGYTEQWINAEDSDLWLKLGVSNGFVYIYSPPVFAYRRHENSAVSMTRKTYEGMIYLITQEESNLYPGDVLRQQQRREIILRHIRPASLLCLKQGLVQEGWLLYMKTFQWHIQQKRIKYILGFLFKSTVAWWMTCFKL